VGEIGRDREEFLYHMKYSEIVLIIRGYRHRNILQYQLQRMQIHAARFCMGNPKGVKPTDIVPLYFDKYKGQDDPPPPPLTESERKQMQAEMDAMNEELENARKNNH